MVNVPTLVGILSKRRTARTREWQAWLGSSTSLVLGFEPGVPGSSTRLGFEPGVAYDPLEGLLELVVSVVARASATPPTPPYK
jgi:hypothetical protein